MRERSKKLAFVLTACLVVSFCGLQFSRAHEPSQSETVTLKPGDTLVVNFEGAESAALEISVKRIAAPLVEQAAAKPAASVTEQVWVTETRKVCGPNGCYLMPVRRLVTRTVAAAAPIAAAPVFAAPVYAEPVGCGCGCPGCTCSGLAATSTRVVYARRWLGWRWR